MTLSRLYPSNIWPLPYKSILFLIVLTYTLAWRFMLPSILLPRWFLPDIFLPHLYLLFKLNPGDPTYLALTVIGPSVAVPFIVDSQLCHLSSHTIVYPSLFNDDYLGADSIKGKTHFYTLTPSTLDILIPSGDKIRVC